MAADRIEALDALLVQAKTAHGRFEATELNGVYDKEWPRWYAVYAIEHGLAALVGHTISIDRLAHFLADSYLEFEAAEPKPSQPWTAYIARRITREL